MTHSHGGDSSDGVPQNLRAWSVDNDSYDVGKFYCDAVDKRGHADVVSCKVTPTLGGMLAQILDDPRNPYRNRGDIVRDALVHRLRWLLEGEPDGEIMQKLRQHMRFTLAKQAEERDREAEELIKTRERQLLRLRREPEEVERIVRECDEDMATLTPVWQDEMKDLIRRFT